MRNEFRRLKFGMVPVEWRQPQIDASEQTLISYLRASKDFSLLGDISSSLEVFTLAKQYIGSNFRDWLIANFNHGSGARASLVRRIVAWVKGGIPVRGLVSEIHRDIKRISFLQGVDPQLQIPIVFQNNPNDQTATSDLDFSIIEDRHFFELIAALGPELTAKFLLTLNGIIQAK